VPPVRWRTQVRGGTAGKEHSSRDQAYAEVARHRAAYARGSRGVRVVRVYRDGELIELVDFAREAALSTDALVAVDRARQDRDRATERAAALTREADTAWRAAIRAAVDAGEPVASVAQAAGISVAQLRRILAAAPPKP
jgi:DNA-binding phage protein